MPLAAVIIDDEEDARSALATLLAQGHPEVALVGKADGVAPALDLIARTKPTLIFLDVEMGATTGFDLLRALGPMRPHVVFTTAHAGYALKAIRFSALDYLLKPIDPSELAEAILKAEDAERSVQRPDQFMALLENLQRDQGKVQRLALPTMEGLVMVDVSDILYCQGDGHYTTFGLIGRKPVVISRNIGQVEDMLPAERFVRIHHSHLIALKHVTRYIRGEGGEVVMADGANLAVSKRKKQDLMDRLDKV